MVDCPSVNNYIKSLDKYQDEFLNNRRTYDLINLHMSENYKTIDVIADEFNKAVAVPIDSEGFRNIGKLHGQMNQLTGLVPPEGSDILSPPSPVLSDKCKQNQSCWPDFAEWLQLKIQVEGNLIAP